MGWVTVVTAIVKIAPGIVSMVERILGPKEGAKKRVAAAKEITEMLRQLVTNNPFGGSPNFEDIDLESVLNALEDEEEFVEKIATLNDAVVDLANYLGRHSA